MPLISLAIYVSYMLLLITCAPTTTAAAAAAARATAITSQHQQQQQQQQQRSWESEESSYYIALPQQQQQQQQQEPQQLADNGSGSSESVGSNIDNNNNILSRLLSRPSNSLSSTSNIKLRPATVFDAGSVSNAAVQQQRQQHIAAVTTQQQQSQQQVPNTLINSQKYNLLNNGISSSSKTRRHAPQQQQPQQPQQQQLLQQQQQLQLNGYARQLQLQQQNVAALNYSSRITAAAQSYHIESYEVPESSQDQATRSRRDFGSGQRRSHGHRQQQQEAKREYRRQRQQQRQQQQQQRQHEHHHQQQQQHQHQQRRKLPRKDRNKQRTNRYCSARDPAQLAFAAPTVIMGVFISRTANRPANFSATMKVLQVYKQQRDLQLPQLVRFQFAQRNGSGECDIYRERLQVRGLIHFNLEQSSDIRYIMFVQQMNPGNFSILGQPIRATQRALESVQEAVSENYAQSASILSITAKPNNATLENNATLRITCELEGQPPPKVTWFKDDKSINHKHRVYKFKHHKRRSQLIVPHFNSSIHAGKYECRAKNKASNTIDKRRIMINAHPVVPFRSDSHYTGPPCLEKYCLHGGSCGFILGINELYCNCPDGYHGKRCEYSTASMSINNPICGVKYYGGYYC
ncbi:hypothetical protein AWZ03_000847 [Drosophila navojoa]|uniref:Protein vein n=1 Tax=Drosophila navojoa TaxID=7232 RepID=A0A484BVB8_DRONA|nr:hypothetical protein AWZ03_000847 [Drosophila navojoa]